MTLRRALMGAAIAAPLLCPVGAFAGDSPFAGLVGAWRGGGSVRLEFGQSERLKCLGYYTAKAAGGLSMAISCASSAFKINMRAALSAAGNQVSGTWDEREFNQTGELTGKATEGGLALNFSGAISGSILVSTNGNAQSVSISTGGGGFTGVSLQFAKND